MKIRNLTPHQINFVSYGATLAIAPEPQPARVVLAEDLPVGTVEIDRPVSLLSSSTSISIVRTGRTGQVTGLPGPEEDTLLIVSQMVAEALPRRADLVFPHDSVRDEQGRVVGCRKLGTVTTAAESVGERWTYLGGEMEMTGVDPQARGT